jgi:GNAT superfamily N-acetyltransferase
MALSDPAMAQEAPLREQDLADAAALVREAGWNQVAADWRIFLDLGTTYAVRNSRGRVVATAATLAYARFAWIGMVLVAGEYRRQGLARRLLNRCVADLTARGLVPMLDATPAGRAVYSRIGFEDLWGMHRLACGEWQGSGMEVAAADGASIRPIADADWPALCRYDAAAFGCDRSTVLARLRGRVPGADLVAQRGDRPVGFLLGRDGRTASQLGPLVAEDQQVARALLMHALAAVGGPIYVDLADERAELRAELEQRGFAPQRPFTRMAYRHAQSFDDPARRFAIAAAEFG